MSLPIVAAAGFALIVTNNRSLDASRPDLRYADDDGVKYAQLFEELLGEDHVLLLTELDAETRALYPEWNKRAIAPTRDNFDRAIERVQDAKELYLVLAGHGDVDRGQGYIELADRRLSAADLEERVIARLDAARIHLVLDSCNSYFMLSPRKPGGTRFAASDHDTRDLLDRHPNVGALISTSAEAVTYEWSEVQSGIFSYELRSGLRGGADADTDGRISYEELKAFLATANRSIENDLYRPKIYARGPAADDRAILLAFAEHGRRELELPKEGARRITIRDHLGVRVLDLHKEDGTPAVLRLPSHGELGVFEELPGERPTIAFRTITATVVGRTRIDALPLSEPAIAARGEAPVFHSVFAAPFGKTALEEFRNTPPAPEAAIYGVSKRDSDRLGLYLRTTAGYEREGRYFGGAAMFGISAYLGALGGYELSRPGDGPHLQGGISLALAAGTLLTGVLTLAISSDSEDLVEEYAHLDLSTEGARGRAVRETETRLMTIADDYKTFRTTSGWITLVSGAAIGAISGYQLAQNDGMNVNVGTLGWAVIATIFGVYQLWIHEYPAERTWQLYAEDKAVGD